MSEIHSSVQKLYQAARELRNVSGQSAVARLLDESPQTVKNWEKRGISEGGALKAQRKIGCDANWLLSDGSAMELQAWRPADEMPQRIQSTLDWPFSMISRDHIDRLTPAQRGHIESTVLMLLGAKEIDRNEQRPESYGKAA